MTVFDRFTTTFLIATLLTSGAVALQFTPVSLAGLTPTDIVTRFLGLVFIALVIERAVEIYIKNRFQGAPASPGLKAAKRRAAANASLLLSLAVAVSGLRVLAQFLPGGPDTALANVALQAMVFDAVDIVLTCLLLSGGADGMHHLVKGFLSETDETTPA